MVIWPPLTPSKWYPITKMGLADTANPLISLVGVSRDRPWPKGISGNPAGRPHLQVILAELTPSAI
jgi:hypothetical protein